MGLNVDQQRLLFRDKMMSDDDSIHSHGVVDGIIIYLVRRLRGGTRTKRRRIKLVSTSFQGHDGVSFGGYCSIKHKTGESIESHSSSLKHIGVKDAGATKEDSEEEGGEVA